MKNILKLLFLTFTFLGSIFSISANETLTAKVGVLGSGGGSSFGLKSRQKILASDKLQVQVQAKAGLHLYIIANTGKQARLLYTDQLADNKTHYYPSKTLAKSFFKEGAGRNRGLVVVIAKNRVSQLESMKANPESAGLWRMTEMKLLQNGRPSLSGGSKKPTPVAANMRAMQTKNVMRNFTGKKQLLVVKYSLNVAKK